MKACVVAFTTVLGVIGPRDEVARFAQAMEIELRANDQKPGWARMSYARLLQRLRQETAELDRAIAEHRSAAEIVREAADVANFAMMIADNALNDARAAGDERNEG